MEPNDTPLNRLNIPALIMDAGLIVYAIIFTGQLERARHVIPDWLIPWSFLLPAFTLPWYLGFVAARYTDTDNLPKWMRDRRVLMGFLGAALIGLFAFLILSAMHFDRNDFPEWITPIGFILFSLGSTLGIVAFTLHGGGRSSFIQTPSTLTPEESNEWTQLIAILVVGGSLLAIVLSSLLSRIGWSEGAYFTAAVLFMILWIMLVTYYLVKWHADVRKTRLYKYAQFTLVYILFPLLITTGFIFYDYLMRGFTLASVEGSTGMGGGPTPTSLAVTLLMIAPLRFMLALAPPARWLNLILAVFALLIFARVL